METLRHSGVRVERRYLALAEVHPGFKRLKFTPHDFRRIFITELVNSGLLIHVGAALLGHLNVQTTRGYVAGFDKGVICPYQDHRRQIRPSDEYRDTTSDEWAEFEEHFERRKVERAPAGPYGAPCQHEHVCIRCLRLHVNSKMFAWLSELEADLRQRRMRAAADVWFGEIEGIDLTLTFLRAKGDETQRRVQRSAVHLSIPARRRPLKSG
ncbi:tyrosine-type recombinase/integrase [Streptomyces sp. NPDC017082]|uniref:tyrosine-type recombinase/integrase n=1 Tax=Streptomyces sp. NPDC017082 TaxID=3364974 RepID=UPI0037B4C3B2